MNERQLLTIFFARYVTDNKKALIEKVLAHRTRFITLILENIYQSQNASAIIRTCECLGLQEVHIIEAEANYTVNRKVMKGANKWIELIKYKERGGNNTQNCFQRLRASGYKILVADPQHTSVSIHDVPLDQKIALLVGNELHGVSAYARENADTLVHVPMFGFTESFNVSVSAAIALTAMLKTLRQSDVHWQLNQEDQENIRLKWYRSCVRKADLLEREYLRSIQ